MGKGKRCELRQQVPKFEAFMPKNRDGVTSPRAAARIQHLKTLALNFMPQLFFAENFQKFPPRDVSALKFPVQRAWRNNKT